VPGGLVTPDFFKVMGAAPVMGREFTPDDDRPNGPRVIVVGYGFWKDRLGGRPDVVGSTLENQQPSVRDRRCRPGGLGISRERSHLGPGPE
jgi:hypothetical protein